MTRLPGVVRVVAHAVPPSPPPPSAHSLPADAFKSPFDALNDWGYPTSSTCTSSTANNWSTAAGIPAGVLANIVTVDLSFNSLSSLSWTVLAGFSGNSLNLEHNQLSSAGP
jgi:hypothetical protein